jgi:hypothetical protein
MMWGAELTRKVIYGPYDLRFLEDSTTPRGKILYRKGRFHIHPETAAALRAWLR